MVWNTLKRLWGGDSAQNSARGSAGADLATISDGELVAMNQDLGRAQDEIRDKRRAINAELRRRDATVQGQVLTVDAEA